MFVRVFYCVGIHKFLKGGGGYDEVREKALHSTKGEG